MDRTITAALQPGRYIPWDEGFSFVSGLRRLEEEIRKLAGSGPVRGVELYETFIAGCNEKAEEIDDSDDELGIFVGGLFCGWIKARQESGADREETAELLCARMDDDPYGFCNDLERQAVKVLDPAGREAFERMVRARFDAALGEREQPGQNRNYACDRWSQMLRAVYAEQRNVEKYIELTSTTELTETDCDAIATMFQAKRNPEDALAWVDRGLKIQKHGAFSGVAGSKLAGMRRALLKKLGRSKDALASAWIDFQTHPSKLTLPGTPSVRSKS